MKRMTFTEAYAEYGAKLRNVNWACSAITDDESALVFSCFEDRFDHKRGNIRRYKDKLERWENPHGRKLAREHLRKAFEDKLPVRLVSVVLDDSKNANAKRKQCKPSVCADEIGRVIKFDGDNFVIAFQRTEK